MPGPDGKMVWKDETTATADKMREGKPPKLGRAQILNLPIVGEKMHRIIMIQS